jgi:hypothetical protein
MKLINAKSNYTLTVNGEDFSFMKLQDLQHFATSILIEVNKQSLLGSQFFTLYIKVLEFTDNESDVQETLTLKARTEDSEVVLFTMTKYLDTNDEASYAEALNKAVKATTQNLEIEQVQ